MDVCCLNRVVALAEYAQTAIKNVVNATPTQPMGVHNFTKKSELSFTHREMGNAEFGIQCSETTLREERSGGYLHVP